MKKFKVGSRVRLKEDVLTRRRDSRCFQLIHRQKSKSKTAVITVVYRDVEGGVRLDKELEGFKSWNLKDLELVELP